ncbi:PAAR domain-containing protein [Ralstonia syzygii]|uniref:PAAR domain-containing protein n=1 Tax=Ralstonia syzygii TaxID=28097 RepID=UPI001E3E4D01|nr:hypothetical protein LMG10661_03422 [Ralstonia syzygii subsp. syzygii]
MQGSKPFIRVGDKTDHGGTVLTGDQTTIFYGKATARDGDMTVCPKCKGTFPILKGNGIVIDGNAGSAYARHGDKTACGATLLASQPLGTASDMVSGTNSSHAGEIAAQAAAIAAPTASGVCLECLAKAAASGSATVMRG